MQIKTMKQGWEIKRLEEVAIKLFAGGDKPKIFSEHPTEDLNIPIYANGVSLDGLVGYTDKAVVDKESITISARGTIGYCCVRKTPFVPIVRLITIIPTEYIKTEFLYYALSNATIENNGVAIPQLTIPMIKGIPIHVPPREEQERIVAELDCLSGVIEKKREQLRELDALAQSIFYQMFGDPITNEKGWEVKKFEDCYKLASGNGLSAKQIIDGDYPVYGGNGIVGYHHEYNLDGNNIIIGRVGALCGNVRNVEGKAFITDNAFILTKKIDNDNVFLLHLLRIHNLRKYAREAMQPVISNAGLKNINIIITPLTLQQEFADKIEAIEKQKELIKKSISETETLFNARMDYYFN